LLDEVNSCDERLFKLLWVSSAVFVLALPLIFWAERKLLFECYMLPAYLAITVREMPYDVWLKTYGPLFCLASFANSIYDVSLVLGLVP